MGCAKLITAPIIHDLGPESMPRIHEKLLRKHMQPTARRTQITRADALDGRSWLSEAPICGHLTEYNISHCGIMEAAYPMELLRPELSGTFFLACLGGVGSVLIDGQWRTIRSGEACLQPPFIANGLKAVRQDSWNFCWVRYRKMAPSQGIASANTPTLGPFQHTGLHMALQGLFAEASGHGSSENLGHWAALIHGYVTSFAKPFQVTDRLEKVWSAVREKLDHNWQLESLAELACMSKEHLRRIARKELGRSPMAQVTFLRMTFAAEQLDETDHKVAYIARQVGYENPFAFSNTFLRWSGFRPSNFRKRLGL